MTFGRHPRRPDDWPSSHVRARGDLAERMDGALETPEATWLDGHLATCPDCRRVADEYVTQRFELRALRDHQPRPPRDLWARTAAAIELEAGSRGGRRGVAARPSLAVPTAFIATALVVAVAAGLLTSSQLTRPNGDGGSVPEVALNPSSAAATGASIDAGPTPIAVAKRVDYVGRDSLGRLQVKTTTIDEVCPAGTPKPCDTGGPVEDRSVTIDQNAQAVFGDGEEGKRLIVVSSPTTVDSGTIAVVSLAADGGAGSPSPSPTASATASPTPSTASASPATGASPSPSARSTASASPSPSVVASASPTPLISASPTGSIDVTPPSGATREIAHGVALVGQTAAYSASGTWFAFTARPIDGSAGPDVYLWRVGTDAAKRATTDGRSVFGSWLGEDIVGSRAVADGGGAASGLAAESFVLDPSTASVTTVPQAGSAWRPVVDPSGRRAVYWSGTLRAQGSSYAPDGGRLVLGDWGIDVAGPSGSPSSTARPSDQAAARHETTIGPGRIDDWDARWDSDGTHLAIWIADRQNPAIGRLSLYAVSSFDGSIDLKKPLLESRRATAGFSISDGELVWAEPSSDPKATDGSIQLLAWTDQGVGTVQTVSGPAIVIR